MHPHADCNITEQEIDTAAVVVEMLLRADGACEFIRIALVLAVYSALRAVACGAVYLKPYVL